MNIQDMLHGNDTTPSPWGNGSKYPDFAAYAQAQGYIPKTQAAFYQRPTYQNTQVAETPNYIGMNPLSTSDWQTFFNARYGMSPQVPQQINPLVSGQIGSNQALGQSILGGLQ